MRISIAALLLAPATALAGGYYIPNENARDLALSQANVASQNGPEAAHSNPSALAGQKGLAISASGQMLYNSTTWSDPTLGTSTLRPKANWPPEVAVSYGNDLPNGMSYGLGLAFLVPGGGSLVWPQNWPGAAEVQEVDQKLYVTEISGAIQPHPMVKLGATFLWYQFQETFSRQIYFGGPQATASLGMSGGAPTFGLSGEFHAPRDIPLTIAVAYRHQAPTTLDGHVHFDNVPPSYATLLQDQAVHEKLTIPNDFYLGAAYDVIPNLTLMASWNLERWVVYGSDTFVGEKGLPPIVVDRNYRNAWVYRFGAEYSKPSFLPNLTLRAGLLRSISEQPTNTVSPSLTDGNSWAVSVGAGYEIIRNLRADVGYQYAWFGTVTSSPNAFPGSYDTYVHLLSVGVVYRFDNL